MRTLALFILALLLTAVGSTDARAQDMTLIMDGARAWSQNCTRCHNARSPLERTDREWVTIVQHMRARGNLTQTEAVAVATFLQSSNGDEPGSPLGPEPAADGRTAAPDASESTEKAAAERDRSDAAGVDAGRSERISELDLRKLRVLLDAQ